MEKNDTNYEAMSTEQLEELLRQDCDAPAELELPLDTAFRICDILVERSKKRHSPEELHRLFQECLTLYCGQEDET